MNLSFDAKTMFFSYQKFGTKFWHPWKVNVDGTNLVQLTDGPYYDISPCEPPNGDLVFVSTRRFGHPGVHVNLLNIFQYSSQHAGLGTQSASRVRRRTSLP